MPAEMTEPARILLVDDDLFFSARILSVLTKLGYATERAATADDALVKLAAAPAEIVIVNFGSRKLSISGALDLVQRVKSRYRVARVVAYLSHTKIPAIRAQANAAGVDRLCANSAITMRLPDILRSVLGGESGRF